MRPFLIALLAITCPFGLAVSAGDPSGPQIVDGAHDAHVTVSPSISVPDPSVDILAVTLSTEGDDLKIVVEVTNLSFKPLMLRPFQKYYSLAFHNDAYARVFVSVSEVQTYGWNGDMACFDASWRQTCRMSLPPPVFDHEANTVEYRAPLSVIGGPVLAPSLFTLVEYREMPLAYPLLYVGDRAPDCDIPRCGGGQDYYPTAG